MIPKSLRLMTGAMSVFYSNQADCRQPRSIDVLALTKENFFGPPSPAPVPQSPMLTGGIEDNSPASVLRGDSGKRASGSNLLRKIARATGLQRPVDGFLRELLRSMNTEEGAAVMQKCGASVIAEGSFTGDILCRLPDTIAANFPDARAIIRELWDNPYAAIGRKIIGQPHGGKILYIKLETNYPEFLATTFTAAMKPCHSREQQQVIRDLLQNGRMHSYGADLRYWPTFLKRAFRHARNACTSQDQKKLITAIFSGNSELQGVDPSLWNASFTVQLLPSEESLDLPKYLVII